MENTTLKTLFTLEKENQYTECRIVRTRLEQLELLGDAYMFLSYFCKDQITFSMQLIKKPS